MYISSIHRYANTDQHNRPKLPLITIEIIITYISNRRNQFTESDFMHYHGPIMKHKLWITLATCLAYCIDKELYKAIDYLKTQVEILKELQQQQNSKRILLNNNQRRRLARKAKALTRKLLEETTALFTPETVLGWYRKLIAGKYDSSHSRKKIGHHNIHKQIVRLVIQIKQENPQWGTQRICDTVNSLGFEVCRTTIRNILINHGSMTPNPIGNRHGSSLSKPTSISSPPQTFSPLRY